MPRSLPIPDQIQDVTCPFCGLLCDDLVVGHDAGRLKVLANGCRLAAPGFERPAGDFQARIRGKPATLAEAASEAAKHLRNARLPLIGGLATDVAGARAAASLANRVGGTLDHMNSAATMRNVLVVADGGWIITTLSEVRNRADLLVVVGGDIAGRFPRFFERCIANRETLFGGERTCEVVSLGGGLPADLRLPGPAPTVIPCEGPRLHEAFGVLRVLLAGGPLNATVAAGVSMDTWRALAAKLRAAKYGVFAWAAADFDFPHAELTVQALAELIKDLNRDTRFSGVPLGGSDGDLTVDTVLQWQTGFATRTSYGQGQAEQDPYHLAGPRLLARGEADLLLWISSFNPSRGPIATGGPLLVLGHPAMALERVPDVFIPVGTPGLDHAGHLFRSDRVVALSLGRLRATSLPTVAEVLTAIEAAL
jgi:formylmethanofuran dehydrogenase subunit B